MFQCAVCMHGGHQACYSKYYSHRPPDKIIVPVTSLHRAGRSLDIVYLHFGATSSNPNPPTGLGAPTVPPPALRGRALSRTNSTTTTGDGESDDGAADGEGGLSGSYESTGPRGSAFIPFSANVVLGQLCAAGCGHNCWAIHERE